MQSEPPTAALTVACHVRPTLVLEPIDSKIETLRACERDGVVDALLLRSWPGEVAMVEDSPHPEVVEEYERFLDWAERAGVEIHPPFQRRETTSVASDHAIERLVTPTVALACYEDDRLVGVFPHTDDETTHTVPEAIAALRTGELPEPLREHAGIGEPTIAERSIPRPVGASDGRTTAASDPDSSGATGIGPLCPDCDTVLTNVQGILDCAECEWVGAERSTPLASSL